MPFPGPTRIDPQAAMDAVQGGFVRLVDQYWPHRSPRWVPPLPWDPPIDLLETPEDYLILADLPGVDPAAIDLSLDGSVLHLRGERHLPAIAGEPVASGPRERRSGPFRREVVLPGHADAGGVQAEMTDGILRIRIPKAGGSRTRTIPIQSS